MIHLCIQANAPYSLFSKGLANELTLLGLDARFRPLGLRSLYAIEKFGNGRVVHSISALSNILVETVSFLPCIRPGDIVLSYEMFGLVSSWQDGLLLRAAKKKGAKIVSIIQDAWPILDSHLHRAGCDKRAEISDCLGCVSPQLVDLIAKRYPKRKVFLMEEAVDVDRMSPDFAQNDPVVCWSGPPTKIKEVETMLPVLERVYKKFPFRLKIVSGTKEMRLQTIIPVDFSPFDTSLRIGQLGNSTIGFAQYKDNAYDRCKGNYKIKTYLAAGCAIVSNPVGYNHELIRPGVNGLFANTPEEWEAAFLRLLRDPEERLSMRKASRELAVRRFSYSAIAKQYAGVLSGLVV